MTKESQNQKVLKRLTEGQTITQAQAWTWWKLTRLAARINELRKRGYEIETENVKGNGTRYARYRLDA